MYMLMVVVAMLLLQVLLLQPQLMMLLLLLFLRVDLAVAVHGGRRLLHIRSMLIALICHCGGNKRLDLRVS